MKKISVSFFAAIMLLAGCQTQPAPTVQAPPSSPQPQTTQETPAVTQETPASTPATVSVPSATKQDETPSAVRMQKPVGDFHYDEAVSDYVGTLYLQGTVKTVEMSEGFCEENCKKFDYAFFNYDSEYDAGNPDLKKFMNMNEGNSFAGGNAIGIGCVEEQGIRRKAFENSEMKEFTIGQTDTQTILNASASAPVLLKITRPGPVPGMGAPDCYTHFTGIEVVKFADNV